MKKLEKSQVQEIVNCMYMKKFKSGDYVIKEGEGGNDMYVLAGKMNFQIRTVIVATAITIAIVLVMSMSSFYDVTNVIFVCCRCHHFMMSSVSSLCEVNFIIL